MNRTELDHLTNQDVPQPRDQSPDRRQEQIITTVVAHGHSEVVRIITPIVRSAFGTSLGERTETRGLAPLHDGEARRLAAILASAHSSGP